MKQIEYIGNGEVQRISEIIKKENLKRIFLVTGKNSFEKSGAKDSIEKILFRDNVMFTRFHNFSPNPKIHEIRNGYEIFKRQGNSDLILAVGGGSAIDVAKTIKYLYYEEVRKKILLLAMPTTAGSGSEATYFIVYYKGKKKQSEGSPGITLPDYVICDPDFSKTLPPKIMASTGIDALGQAIESYWSINSTQKSKKYSKKAIRLSINNLENAVNNKDLESISNLIVAANLAGKAINITKTTACHSLAYPITSYFNIPHGHAVGLTLGEMLMFNSNITPKDCLDKRGYKYVKKNIRDIVTILGCKNPEEVPIKISLLMKLIGLETKFSEWGMTKKDLELIIKEGFNTERVKNNPRVLTGKSLRRILGKVY